MSGKFGCPVRTLRWSVRSCPTAPAPYLLPQALSTTMGYLVIIYSDIQILKMKEIIVKKKSPRWIVAFNIIQSVLPNYMTTLDGGQSLNPNRGLSLNPYRGQVWHHQYLNFGPSVIGCVEGFIGRLEKLKGATIEKKRNFIQSKKNLQQTFWQKI